MKVTTKDAKHQYVLKPPLQKPLKTSNNTLLNSKIKFTNPKKPKTIPHPKKYVTCSFPS